MTSIADYIWQSKYRHDETSIDDTWQRVATSVAAAEADQRRWCDAFYEELAGLRFLPGGRIIAGAGTGRRVTLFNCFASGEIHDSLDSILDSLNNAAVTMRQGGGIGCDFSRLRPSGSPAVHSGVIASGPVSFMQVWDAMCATLLSTSVRRGAMMATLRCDHPDIEAFIDAKLGGDTLTNFNLSVLVTDRFMRAVADAADWPLVFPPADADAPVDNGIEAHKTVKARDLWQQIAAAAHASAEPGILFVDRVNADNNLQYCETISTTNPCGEIPLPPHGACNLGSINLARFVRRPFAAGAEIDEAAIEATARCGVRFLDDVIDVSGFPLPQQAEQARRTRRIGLGVTGLADALIMLGLDYDSDEGRSLARRIMQRIRDAAYACSVGLAVEKVAFPGFERDRYLDGPFIQRLPADIRDGIAANGIRNSHVLAIAPTGTISLLAGNVSSGIEPVFALDAVRDVRAPDNAIETVDVRDFAYAAWLTSGGDPAHPPKALVTAEALAPDAHLEMQACLQPFVDNAISKTVNLPAASSVDDILGLYGRAYELGLKGCTIYRSGSLAGQVLRSRDEARCCDVVRAA